MPFTSMGGCEIPVAPSAATPGRARYAWSPLSQCVFRQRGSAVGSEQKAGPPVLLPHGRAGEGVQSLTQQDQQVPPVPQHCAEQPRVSESSALGNSCALIPVCW